MNVRIEITNWMGVFPAEIEDDVGKMKALSYSFLKSCTLF
jgi:hypothetical protein